MTPAGSALVDALARLGAGSNLTADEMTAAVDAIMAGDAPEAVVAAFLTALRVKGETADDLAGAVRAVRSRMAPLDGPLPAVVDTCGTGGDGASTVNISTAAAIVVAACGVPVAKHGNRSASGTSGSAEVLTELGVAIEAEPAVVRRCLLDLGITFLFAPRFHPAMRFAAAARRQLPFRTVFNLVGPLANPARPAYQLIGVPDLRAAGLVAEALHGLGTTRAAVVTASPGEPGSGSPGLDEVALDRPTHVRWVEAGRTTALTWTADDFGLPHTPAAELRVSGAVESASRLRGLLAGEPGPVRAVVLANSAAALFVAGRVDSLRAGVAAAAEAIDSGSAASLLERWKVMSRG